MNKIFSTSILAVAYIFICFSCENKSESNSSVVSDTLTNPVARAQVPLKEKVLTKAEQDALTPDMVIQRLKEGNQRYMKNDLTQRDHSALVRAAASGQYPKAVVISCVDKRVIV